MFRYRSMKLEDRHELRMSMLQGSRRCFYCGKTVGVKTSSLDHVVPLSKGGLDAAHNIVLCCIPCNSSKDDRTIDQWIADLRNAKSTHDGMNRKRLGTEQSKAN